MFISSLVFIFIISNFNSNSFTDNIKKKYFPQKINGRINDVQTIKGGSLSITLLNRENKFEGITIKNDGINNKIKSGIYFEKLPSSNKCFLKKNDSILFFLIVIFFLRKTLLKLER